MYIIPFEIVAGHRRWQAARMAGRHAKALKAAKAAKAAAAKPARKGK